MRGCLNGTPSSPAAFLEGLYVVPNARRRGVVPCCTPGLLAYHELSLIAAS